MDATVMAWALSVRVRSDEADEWLRRLQSLTDVEEWTKEGKKRVAILRAMDFAATLELPAWNEFSNRWIDATRRERNVPASAELLQWLHRHGKHEAVAEVANLFSDSLKLEPEGSAAENAIVVLVRVLVADSCVRSGKWRSALEWCEEANWGAYEALRFLMMARAEIGESKNSSMLAQRSIRLAVGLAKGDNELLETLDRAAREYGAETIWIELHRGIGDRGGSDSIRKRSLQLLKRHSLEIGELGLFRECAEKLTQLNPENWGDRHNALFAGALMPTMPSTTISGLRSLHDEVADSADVAASLGVALARSGKNEEALRAIESIPLEERFSPGIAPFCAIVYGLLGDQETAWAFEALPSEVHFQQTKDLLERALGRGHG